MMDTERRLFQFVSSRSKTFASRHPGRLEDISNLANSVQFGPFNFSSNIVDGALCHDDIQIVAWMLEDLPDLPPNAMP